MKAEVFPHHCLFHRYDEQQKKAPFQKFPREPQRGDQKLNLAVSKVDTLFLKVPFSQFCLLAPSFCPAYLLTSSSVQARFHKSSLAATIHLFIFIVQMDCVWRVSEPLLQVSLWTSSPGGWAGSS